MTKKELSKRIDEWANQFDPDETVLTALYETLGVEIETCSLCNRTVPATRVHKVSGRFIGECCWDSRLD